MTDAPERIWAQDAVPLTCNCIGGGWWDDEEPKRDYGHIIEYIRADIHAAALAENERLRAAVKPAYCEGLGRGWTKVENTLDIIEEWRSSAAYITLGEEG